jgi:sulfite exporter TauE/SafE
MDAQTMMTDASFYIALGAAFVAGLAGSVHCIVMCGGLAGALSMRRPAASERLSVLRQAGAYQLGRIGGYGLAGAIVGGLGAAIPAVADTPMLVSLARLGAALAVIAVALRLLVDWNALAWIERLGARFWKLIHPVARDVAGRASTSRNLLLGLLWGWMPCGLVYSILLVAALHGGALQGAGIMVAFGMGTLPAMLAASLLTARLANHFRRSGIRQVGGAALLVFGLWLGMATLTVDHGAEHDHAGHAAIDHAQHIAHR